VLGAACRYLDVISPAIAAICDKVNIAIPGRDVILRCIVKRAQENLHMIVSTVRSEHSHMSIMPLRPLCEDLIYGCWLRTLPASEADEMIHLGTMVDLLNGLKVQSRFLPTAYAQFTLLAGEGKGEASEWLSRQNSYLRANSRADSHKQKFRRQLRELGIRLGWPSGRQPSIRDMAASCGLSDFYDFFYHGASKSVHSNLHNMTRMVWGTPEESFSITSRNFERYYARFALVYGVWLCDELLDRIVQQEFPAEFGLISKEAHDVWLAMVLVGSARTGTFPPLITEEELRWSQRKIDPLSSQ
jgi:hypothetical protein